MRRSRGVIDPHLYFDCPITVYPYAQPDDVPPRKFARYVSEMEHSPDKCLVVLYHWSSTEWIATPFIVEKRHVVVANYPSEPPPLPQWACDAQNNRLNAR